MIILTRVMFLSPECRKGYNLLTRLFSFCQFNLCVVTVEAVVFRAWSWTLFHVGCNVRFAHDRLLNLLWILRVTTNCKHGMLRKKLCPEFRFFGFVSQQSFNFSLPLQLIYIPYASAMNTYDFIYIIHCTLMYFNVFLVSKYLKYRQYLSELSWGQDC